MPRGQTVRWRTASLEPPLPPSMVVWVHWLRAACLVDGGAPEPPRVVSRVEPQRVRTNTTASPFSVSLVHSLCCGRRHLKTTQVGGY